MSVSAAYERWVLAWVRKRPWRAYDSDDVSTAFYAGWRAAQLAARQAEAQSRRECSAAEVEAAETGGERAMEEAT